MSSATRSANAQAASRRAGRQRVRAPASSDCNFHDLRREAGSRWLEGGVPLQVVRDWLGHANVSQTSTYLASTSEGGFEAMRRFEAFQKQIASPCITGQNTAPQSATTGTDAGQRTTENIDETRSDDDSDPTFNHGVP